MMTTMTYEREYPTAEQIANHLMEMGIEPYVSGGKWRFEFTEAQVAEFAGRVAAEVEKESTR